MLSSRTFASLVVLLGFGSSVRLQIKAGSNYTQKQVRLREPGLALSANDAKAKFLQVDARSENFLKIKDVMTKDADRFPLQKTLVAFDFDLTLRDDKPGGQGGIRLRLEETTRDFLQWLRDNQVPVIVVTARSATPRTWVRTWDQVETLEIQEFLGQHVPARINNGSIKKPCNPGSCNVFEFSHNSNLFSYVEGNAVIASGHAKGEAIMHFIEIHGLDVNQVIFVDDYATHATNVAKICKEYDSIQRIVGVWLASFDHGHATKEFVDSVFETTDKLEACFENEKFSACKPKFYKNSWCEPSMPGFLGDNSFNPLLPQNLYNVETVLLGKFPEGDEVIGPETALTLARKQDEQIRGMWRICREKEAQEKREMEKATQAKQKEMADKGVLAACTGTFQCIKNKNKPKEKRTCDIDIPPCSDFL